jgi:translation initiation factor IF-3
VPVPRRFDRRPPERDSTRINDRIRVPEVRLVGEDGKQIGVIKTTEALAYAQERDLDLVEVAADARPPVCRVLDYSKYKYEQEQKQKAARKHQQQINIREIKFRPKIAQNDYDTKKGHVRRFLKGKDKVKVTIMFRGREVTHPERGVALLNRLAEELVDVGTVEQSPLQDGRNMTMMLGPSKAVLAGELEGDAPAADAAEVKADAAPAADAPVVESDAAPAADAPVADAPAVESDAAEVKADAGSNGHQNGDARKEPSPASSDAAA